CEWSGIIEIMFYGDRTIIYQIKDMISPFLQFYGQSMGSASYTSPFRMKWSDICKYDVFHLFINVLRQ
ncbi:MAG TPA: hypothetical protein DEB74_13630, partial [Lachnospiraceae bacterium]|nr:hypothetical protein [Lachnospiraceae bacterium]